MAWSVGHQFCFMMEFDSIPKKKKRKKEGKKTEVSYIRINAIVHISEDDRKKKIAAIPLCEGE